MEQFFFYFLQESFIKETNLVRSFTWILAHSFVPVVDQLIDKLHCNPTIRIAKDSPQPAIIKIKVPLGILVQNIPGHPDIIHLQVF